MTASYGWSATNRQSSEDDRRSIEEFRQGLVEAALARYDTNGHVHRAATAAAAYDLMVKHWFDGLDARSFDPMIAGPNRVRAELNRRARTPWRQPAPRRARLVTR